MCKLSKDFLLFARKATSVSFRYDRGASNILASYSKDGAYDAISEMRMPSKHRVTCYNKLGPSQPNKCVCCILSAQYTPEWKTLVDHVLREGDELSMHWIIGGGNTGSLTKAGFIVEQLNLEVARMVRGKRILMTFRLVEHIGYDNTARMCQL